jgi:uncharacterized protein (DUF362 family)
MMKQVLMALAMLACSLALKGETPDIVAAKGPDAFASTLRAVEGLGGMERFVKPGNRVGILVNSGFREKGAYVDPDVVIAAIQMVYDAGASDVVFLQHIVPEYWERSPLEPQFRDMIARTRSLEKNHFPSVYDEEWFVQIPTVEGAVAVKDLEVVREFFDVDVFVNIPIAKNHTLTVLTNAMKNVMGINTRAANVKFHLDGPARNDPGFLAQCIADLNLLRKADLIISDVTYVITTNGPSGPGEIVAPGKVVAGTDPVAMDAYCAELIGFFAEDVLTIEKGYELGLGEMDLDRVNVLVIEDIPAQ